MAIQLSKLKNWGYHVVIAIDQLFNALLGGAADETLSSRTYRGAILAQKPKKRWRVLYPVINGLFFDKEHCKTAYESEVNRKQYPQGFEGNVEKGSEKA
ncbi:DNA helicase UvrD [[Haemophilus] felis]|uniref:DNA helicase UvrD n=1 Tax=[Haemophilus] felis TaxID=123822 RepID=A0A1T0B2N9_9PAST|nr:DNA helicase UvrD [[Haemophilus] felis]NBI40143.1 DNA helicase UvrD [[Haemophilus] felis]OOS04179.1 DNA helicase UvrD [[Haemophilus] felis]